MSESTESSSRSCPKCGAALPSAATSGLCPRCLMAEAMLPTQPEAATGSTQKILSPEELAPHFPQLEILEYLGRGGMGVVYKARQLSLNRLVALKLLAPERVTDTQFAERFAREAQALAALSHPNIVTIHDFGQAGGFYFLLMEFVDGVNLRQAMKAGRFTPEQALAVVPPVCEALQYAHEHGIVHRDIKPENLLLDKEGRVKIADFGIAKMLGSDSSGVGMAQSQPAGTPQYMAPEQTANPQQTDSRADIYSLGVVLYEMLTGELPGNRLEPPSKRVQIDVRLDEVVLRALEKDPEHRYQTANQVKADVETIVATSGASHGRREPPVMTDDTPLPTDEAVRVNARRLVAAPAVGLIVSGCLNLLGMAAVALVAGLGVASMPFHVMQPSPPFMLPLRGLLLSGLGLGVTLLFPISLLIILGGLRMRVLRNYGLAVAASIVAIIASPSLLGLPFGIWALIVLSRQEVRAAFEAGPGRRAVTPGGTQIVNPPRSASGWKAALVIALALAGLLIVFLGILGLGLFWMGHTRVVSQQASMDEQAMDEQAARNNAQANQLALLIAQEAQQRALGMAPPIQNQPPLLEAPLTPTPNVPSQPTTIAPAPTSSRDDLQARLSAARGISDFTRKDSASAEVAKAASSAGEGDLALAALKQMSDFTQRDKAAAKAAGIAAEAGNGTLALSALNTMSDFTAKDQACYQCAVALSKSGQRRDANRVAALIADFTVRDRCLAELAGQTNR